MGDAASGADGGGGGGLEWASASADGAGSQASRTDHGLEAIVGGPRVILYLDASALVKRYV